MAEPVGDLVVDLSLDAARFDEQMARVRRHFSGTESDAKKTAAVVEQSMNRQALAAQKAGISVGQHTHGGTVHRRGHAACRRAKPVADPAATGWSG